MEGTIMKTKLIALIIALFLLAPAVALADVQFELKNTSPFTRIVVLFWMDCPHVPDGGPMPIAGAVLEPGKSWKLEDKYPPGVYVARWRTKTGAKPDKVHVIEVGERSREIKITPTEIILMGTNKIKKGISI